MKKIVSLILCVTLFLIIGTVFSGCGSDNSKANYLNYISVNGTDGYGTIDDRADISSIKEKRRMAKDQKNDLLYGKYDLLAEFFHNCEVVVVDGDNGHLSNGDVITLKFKSKSDIDEEFIDQYDIDDNDYTMDEFEYEVKGLKKGKTVNIDENNIYMSFSGFSEKAHLDECNVVGTEAMGVANCTPSKYDNFSNGDILSVDVSLGTNHLYILPNNEPKTIKVKVEGLPEIPNKLEGVDTSEVDKLFNEYVKKVNLLGSGIGDMFPTEFMSEEEDDKYGLETNIRIDNIYPTKIIDNSVKYYKVKSDDIAIYSKQFSLGVSGFAEKDGMFTHKGESFNCTAYGILYVPVVVRNGKLITQKPLNSDENIYTYINSNGSDNEEEILDINLINYNTDNKNKINERYKSIIDKCESHIY